MSKTAKLLIGSLVMLNVTLIGLLMFREQSVTPASAGTRPASEAPVPVASLVERDGGTTFTELPTIPVVEEDSALDPAFSPAIAEEPTAVSATAGAPVATAPEPAQPRVAERQPAPAPRYQPAKPEPPTPRAVPQPAQEVPEPSAEPEATWQLADLRPAPVAQRIEPRDDPRPVTLTLPAGTNIAIRLDVGLHSRRVRAGDHFEASLDEDLLVGDTLLAVAGDAVVGRVTDVLEAGRVKGRERLRLTLSELTLAGKTFPVESSILTEEAKSGESRDAKVVGASAAVGAIIGGIAKGGKGAATGAATGAAAGAGIILGTKGSPVVLDSGTRLDFTLASSVRVTVPAEPYPESPSDDYRETQPEPAAPGVARR